MTSNRNSWLVEYAEKAGRSDHIFEKRNYTSLLAMGLMGEAGSIVSELKKEERDRNAYPIYRNRIHEEIGDFLWYFVRLCDKIDPGFVASLQMRVEAKPKRFSKSKLFLQFGASVGGILNIICDNKNLRVNLPPLLRSVWDLLLQMANNTNVNLSEAANTNLRKTLSQWPHDKRSMGLFDEGFIRREQLPRSLHVIFQESVEDSSRIVKIYKMPERKQIGAQLTDNVEDPDGYRYHDIFHIANATFLGWSPVLRSLMERKRKSDKNIDENQDGARAIITEEAVSAVIFNRAKNLRFFDGKHSVDYDLLKTIQEIVAGFEVEKVPLWQWEEAILRGYDIFRKIRDNKGGEVRINIRRRKIDYVAPNKL